MLKKAVYFSIGALTILGLLVASSFAPLANAVVPGLNKLASVNNSGDGQGGNANSPATTSSRTAAHISANGKYAAFISDASNLVAGDTNGYSDVFVRDLVSNTTERVSVSSAGVEGNNRIGSSDKQNIAISSTGRYVAFSSLATNLIDGQVSPIARVYLRDRLANTTTMVSQLANGTIGSGTADEVSAVSSDGRFVTYIGRGDTTLVPSQQVGLSSMFVFVADMSDRSFRILNPTSINNQFFANAASASCDGSIIAFATAMSLDSSDTDTKDDVYLVDLRNGYKLIGITTSSSNTSYSLVPSVSCNGDYVTFSSNDTAFTTLSTGGLNHTYLYDRINGGISLVDTSAAGVIGNKASNQMAGVDNNGNVAFSSSSTNLKGGTATMYSQVYLKHRDTGAIDLITKPVAGVYSNGSGGDTSISFDGKAVMYLASSYMYPTDLIASDTNGYSDVFYSLTGL